MRLLDANVVLYSEGREHIYRDPCKKIIDSVDAWPEEYAIDTETLQEVLHVYSSRGEPEKGLAVTERLLNLFSDIIPITAAEIRTAIAPARRNARPLCPRCYSRCRGFRA